MTIQAKPLWADKIDPDAERARRERDEPVSCDECGREIAVLRGINGGEIMQALGFQVDILCPTCAEAT